MNIPNVHQSTALPCPSPDTISGAKYSWVPTNDMDRTLTGSATKVGPLKCVCFFFRLRFGLKHDAVGTMQLEIMHEEEVARAGSTWELLRGTVGRVF